MFRYYFSFSVEFFFLKLLHAALQPGEIEHIHTIDINLVKLRKLESLTIPQSKKRKPSINSAIVCDNREHCEHYN